MIGFRDLAWLDTRITTHDDFLFAAGDPHLMKMGLSLGDTEKY